MATELNQYATVSTMKGFVAGMFNSIRGMTDEPYRIVGFKLGHDPSLLDVENNAVTPMPIDTDEALNVFYAGDLTFADFTHIEDSNEIAVKCTLPPGQIDEPHQYSCLYLIDSNGEISHGAVRLPETVLPASGSETHIYIEFPMNDMAG